MHVPHGFCSLPLELAGAALAAGALALTARPAWAQARAAGPLIAGLAAAGMFAVQMVNVPVAAGTSGHALGVLAAALVLGPAAALWGCALVLALQLPFGDGGWQALGINLVNMGVVAGLGGWWLAQRARAAGRLARTAGAAAAGGIGGLLAATLCGAELWLSGRPAAAVPAMAQAHLLTGMLEAAAAAAVVLLAPLPAPGATRQQA
jgi:cobalt/nickel transport system permease protein